jgi:hypothetical protein
MISTRFAACVGQAVVDGAYVQAGVPGQSRSIQMWRNRGLAPGSP